MEAVTASTLLADLRSRGIAVALEGGALVLRAKKGALTPEIKAAVTAGKSELLELVMPEIDGADADDHAGSPAAAVATAKGPSLPEGRAAHDHGPGERIDAGPKEYCQDPQGGTARHPSRTPALDADGESQSELIWEETAADQLLHAEIARLARLCPSDWRITETNAPALHALEDAVDTAFRSEDMGTLTRALREYRLGCFRSFRRPNVAGTLGEEADAITARGTKVRTQYALVEAGDLVVSHDPWTFRPNVGYPQELQERLRDRAALETQVRSIEDRIRTTPEIFGADATAGSGAPIIGPDMIVESGNGRTMGIIHAYKGDGAHPYREWLTQHAREFGLSPERVAEMQEPVLVRVRRTGIDRVRFAREANESTMAAMSSVELARVDAQRLTPALMEMFIPSESGEIATAANRDFIRRFLQQIVSPGDLGRHIDAEAGITQEGISRIRNALFVKAYGDDISAIERLAESPDNNVRSITAAMTNAAPKLALLRDLIEQRRAFPLHIGPDVAAAMNKLSALRNAGIPIRQYLDQQSLFGARELSPEAEHILAFIDATRSSGKKFYEFLSSYTDRVEALGDPHQVSLLGERTIPTKGKIIDAVTRSIGAREAQNKAGRRIVEADILAIVARLGGPGTRLARTTSVNGRMVHEYTASGVEEMF